MEDSFTQSLLTQLNGFVWPFVLLSDSFGLVIMDWQMDQDFCGVS